MSNSIDICPKCGALISPNLARCRQCKEYLHGTQLEGFLLEHLLPESLAAAPGTGVFFLLIVGYYVLMVMFAGVDSAPGFSFFSTQQLGSTWSPGIYEGQYWRFVTSVFAHGGIIHLAFNLYALTKVGPLIEQAYDRKKMIIIFGVSGILSMVISHVFYSEVMGHTVRGSVGASGAVSGLIGACFIAAKRRGPEGRDIAQFMLRWTAYMVLWGFVSPGIDNAAHFGGWVLGAGLAALIPLGITKTVAAQRALSVGVLGLLALCITCIGLMLANLQGFPAALDRDAHGRSMMFFTYVDGVPWDQSSQREFLMECQSAYTDFESARRSKEARAPSPEEMFACEIASRINPTPAVYQALAEFHAAGGSPSRVPGLLQAAERLAEGMGR